MLQTHPQLLGWVGTALVFVAVAIRILRPEWDTYQVGGMWAASRPASCSTRSVSGARSSPTSASATRATAPSPRSACCRPRDCRRRQLPVGAAEQALGLHRQPAEQPLRADGQGAPEPRRSPVKFTVFDRRPSSSASANRLEEYAYASPQVTVDTSIPTRSRWRRRTPGYEIQLRHGGRELQGRHERVTSDTEQELTNALIKAMSDMERKVYFLQGHGEKRPNKTERDGYSAVSGSLRRDNYMVERLVLAQHEGGAGRRDRRR